MKELRSFLERTESEEPLLDLYETDDQLVCEVDLPGINPADVRVMVVGGLMIIEGVKRDLQEAGRRYRYICMERYLDQFRRVIELPVAVSQGEGRAVYRDGVLRITFPLARERVITVAIETDEG